MFITFQEIDESVTLVNSDHVAAVNVDRRVQGYVSFWLTFSGSVPARTRFYFGPPDLTQEEEGRRLIALRRMLSGQNPNDEAWTIAADKESRKLGQDLP